MWFKLLGGVCVIAASSGLGCWMASQWKEHLRTLEQLRKMIFMLKGEIIYANAPLSEAFHHVGQKSVGELGIFFQAISSRIEQQRGELFFTMWKEEIDKLLNCLWEKDKQDLLGFGEHLGYLDANMQERTIFLYLEQLDMSIEYLRCHQRERSRLYTSLGVMGGLFLTIILC